MFKVEINNKEFNFPSKLGDITLGQRIEYQKQYGDDLEARLKEVDELPDGPEKELEQVCISVDMAVASFSFFTKIPEDVIKESNTLSEILNVFATIKELLYANGMNNNRTVFEWNGVKWALYLPEVTSSSTIQFGEFIDSKQIIEDLIALGNGSFERLPRLCAIYLRKPGEKYDPAFAEENSERVKLMYDLPMDIALAVGFFLTDLTNTFRTLIVSSAVQESSQERI